MKPTLLVLAAGIGSRFGGMKQMEPVGPSGEWILDYSVYDAIQAGFGKVVFVIRKEMHEAFYNAVASKYADKIEIECAHQELDDVPGGYPIPADRQKPWGTGHAVYAARHAIATPFAVINADDFYGAEAYQALAQSLNGDHPADYVLVGYPLANTLSDKGPVSRGICQVDSEGNLISVEEHSEIARDSSTAIISGKNAASETVALEGKVLTSLNCWGFHAPFAFQLEDQFKAFLNAHGQEAKSEFYLPAAVDEQSKRGDAAVRALDCDSQWIGMTHKDDLPLAQASIASFIEQGAYPTPLWG